MIKNEVGFNDWLDQQLNVEIPHGIIAFSVNLYESPFQIEIIGSKEFNKEDEDWACNEDWVPEKRPTIVSETLFGNSWENAQENIVAMTQKYLENDSEYANKLKTAKAVGVGFVGGNLSLLR